MALSTFSIFYKTIEIDSTNNLLNFSEGGPEITATITAGLYSPTDLATAIQTAMNVVGGLTYSITFNRSTRTITISAGSNFELLASSGSQVASGPWVIMGYSATDLTGASSYTGDSEAGEEYRNQFILQDYIAPGNLIEKVDESVNESTSGQIEVISFGDRQFLDMTFRFITNLPMDGKVIKNNPNGVSQAQSFFQSIILRGDFEFMPDIDDRNTFYKVKLENTPTSRVGTGYLLKEMTAQSLPGFYEIGPVRLRIVE